MILVDGNTNVLKSRLERRREVLKKNELKINKVKTKIIELKFEKELRGNGNGLTIKVGNPLIDREESFKYL